MKTIPLFKVYMAPDVAGAVGSILHSGYIGQGAKVEEFETGLKAFLGNSYCNTVNSCASALHLALHLAKTRGFPDRDEVLTTSIICTATNFAIMANGLRPRWVDVNPLTCNIDH